LTENHNRSKRPLSAKTRSIPESEALTKFGTRRDFGDRAGQIEGNLMGGNYSSIGNVEGWRVDPFPVNVKETHKIMTVPLFIFDGR
jgi:hypothetical protein